MRKFFRNISLVLTILSNIVLYVGGSIVHLYTVFIAFSVGGFWSALITFIFPVGSQLYWLKYFYNVYGYFFNTYTIIILFYIVGCIVFYGLLAITGTLSENEE